MAVHVLHRTPVNDGFQHSVARVLKKEARSRSNPDAPGASRRSVALNKLADYVLGLERFDSRLCTLRDLARDSDKYELRGQSSRFTALIGTRLDHASPTPEEGLAELVLAGVQDRIGRDRAEGKSQAEWKAHNQQLEAKADEAEDRAAKAEAKAKAAKAVASELRGKAKPEAARANAAEHREQLLRIELDEAIAREDNLKDTLAAIRAKEQEAVAS